MSGFDAGGAADALDDAIRSETRRFVDDKPAVEPAINRHRCRSHRRRVAPDAGPDLGQCQQGRDAPGLIKRVVQREDQVGT